MYSGSGGGGGHGQPAALLLHGDLDLTIHEARDLPNMDVLSSLLRRLCLCPPTAGTTATTRRSLSDDDDGDGRSATNSHHHRRRHQPHGHMLLPASDPYTAVVVPAGPHSETTLARTFVFRNSDAPKWEASFRIPLAHVAARLEFHVKDDDPFGSDLIGTASLPAAAVLASAEAPIRSRWLDLGRPDGRGLFPPGGPAICVSATFIPATTAASASWRSAADAGVPAYFPLRRGCDVRLYQDAHVACGEEAVAGGAFRRGRCWEDLCSAVLGAQRLVYVAGWSVHTRVRLVREEMSPEMQAKAAEVRQLGGVDVEAMGLGDLLKYKSQEGVRVLLLVWDDTTSHDTFFFFKTGGVMQTRDEETKKFFKHSSVMCVLSPRYPSNKLSKIKQKVVGTLFTHHQKCVLVDTPASETTRRVTAFLGGLDLCAGRYDTPSHTLFRGLHDVFHDDVHNPTFGGDGKGPRQPWHDLHCRLDGPAAYDVLTNFEQRWRKATKLREILGKAAWRSHSHSHHKDDALLSLERVSWIQRASDSMPRPDDGDPERWHAQVFRSVDAGSAKGFPRPWERTEVARHHLLCDKNVAVEQSVHAAYVRAVRAAERFVYVENQYFIGASYAWPAYANQGACNLVPMEIALKVAAKISAGEQFAAYIVVPMWPEGNPGSGPAQEILFWQHQTMEMMYRVVARELEAQGLKDRRHPQDYLNFYCLGNREPVEDAAAGDGHCQWPPDRPDDTSPAAAARRHRRFMVYVHSKGMIVDDEYVIIGSANINQRSLDGSRDTELAVGAYQPGHVGTGRPRGEVFGYRMSLWEEHLGREAAERHTAALKRPESPECVSVVNRIARDNWERYVADDRDDWPPDALRMQGHLLRYPVHVRADGGVQPLRGHEFFPDVGGRVVGSRNNLPDPLTM